MKNSDPVKSRKKNYQEIIKFNYKNETIIKLGNNKIKTLFQMIKDIELRNDKDKDKEKDKNKDNHNYNNDNIFFSINKVEDLLKNILIFENFLKKIIVVIKSRDYDRKKKEEIVNHEIDKMNKDIKENNLLILIPDEFLFKNISITSEEYKNFVIRNIYKFDINDIFISKESPFLMTFNKSKEFPGNGKKFLVKYSSDIACEYYSCQLFSEIRDIILSEENHDLREISNNIRTYSITNIGNNYIFSQFIDNNKTFNDIILENLNENYFLNPESNLTNETFRDLYKLDSKPKEMQANLCRKYIETYPKAIISNFLYFNTINPLKWYDNRKNYVISQAVWSMMSLISGLGDRHGGNILIDLENCKICHIDYGYVLGTGLTLNVPEIAKIRFTGNIRYSLGFFEHDEMFSNICSKILNALWRNNQSIIPSMENLIIAKMAEDYDVTFREDCAQKCEYLKRDGL